jgi:HAD superfamily hydrolase (TIGR01509 family)
MIKALIFDFDGLILDTETPEYTALNEAFAEFGQKLPVTTFGIAVGSQYNHEFEPVALLQKLTGKQFDAQSFWQKVNRRSQEMIAQNPILPGVENIIREASARGLLLAVASSSPHAWVDEHLKRFQLFDYFNVIKCRDDVVNVKPEPDLFLAALNALRFAGQIVHADEAVIFEDSLNGIIAARRAGIRVIAVPNQITMHQDIQGETLRFASLADISLDELLKKL